ncbi:hypothetical protein [Clostridium sp. HMP27]|uniref:hypothetical protein n=1 Tax=Clostridium sp. HMP27 TaxID=1487921 RepID=UPI00069086FC|nr:hypothetical protein [Clostridium sp. HMP27]
MSYFNVGLIPYNMTCKYKDEDILPAHDLVIRPLLNVASECFVYGIKKDSEFFQRHSDILIKDKNKYKVALTKEVIKGNETFWNTGCWIRGSVVIVLKKNSINLEEILHHCYRPSQRSSPYTGNSISAVKYCEKLASEDKIAICLPASNGVDWIQIHGSEELIDSLYDKAEILCNELDLWDKQE